MGQREFENLFLLVPYAPPLAWTAKLFLTASKHVLTSCSHDILKFFAFSVNSWLTLCQLEIYAATKIEYDSKTKLPLFLSKSHLCTACPSIAHRIGAPPVFVCCWGLLCLPQESLRLSAVSHLSTALSWIRAWQFLSLSPLCIQKLGLSQITSSSKAFESWPSHPLWHSSSSWKIM